MTGLFQAWLDAREAYLTAVALRDQADAAASNDFPGVPSDVCAHAHWTRPSRTGHGRRLTFRKGRLHAFPGDWSAADCAVALRAYNRTCDDVRARHGFWNRAREVQGLKSISEGLCADLLRTDAHGPSDVLLKLRVACMLAGWDSLETRVPTVVSAVGAAMRDLKKIGDVP